MDISKCCDNMVINFIGSDGVIKGVCGNCGHHHFDRTINTPINSNPRAAEAKSIDEILDEVWNQGFHWDGADYRIVREKATGPAKQTIREAIDRAEPIYTGGTRDMQERHYKKQGVADFKVNLLRELGLDDAQQGREGECG